jgi:glycosyltransferase involved in cell wall biosynthesis
MWKDHLHSLFRPRAGVARAGWKPTEDRVVLADQVASSPAVEDCERSASLFYNLAGADAVAVRHFKLSVLQDIRAEHRAARKTAVVLALSDRVGRRLPPGVRVVPIAYPMSPEPLSLTEAPVAALVADWLWPPNQVALDRLLRAWPSVRDAVPSARLLLAGRRMPQDAIGALAGVEFLGPVARSIDVLSQASVLAFPCPASSGPKVKVLEAMAYGLPVVTTRHGVEGLVLAPGQGAVVVEPRDFGDALGSLMRSPERRAVLGSSGRAAIEAHHAPLPAAKVRLQALAEALGG